MPDGRKPCKRTVEELSRRATMQVRDETDAACAALASRVVEEASVFVHCASASRVGAVWMTKRVLQDGWSIEQAKTEAEAIGLASPKLAAFATEYINSHKR